MSRPFYADERFLYAIFVCLVIGHLLPLLLAYAHRYVQAHMHTHTNTTYEEPPVKLEPFKSINSTHTYERDQVCDFNSHLADAAFRDASSSLTVDASALRESVYKASKSVLGAVDLLVGLPRTGSYTHTKTPTRTHVGWRLASSLMLTKEFVDEYMMQALVHNLIDGRFGILNTFGELEEYNVAYKEQLSTSLPYVLHDKVQLLTTNQPQMFTAKPRSAFFFAAQPTHVHSHTRTSVAQYDSRTFDHKGWEVIAGRTNVAASTLMGVPQKVALMGNVVLTGMALAVLPLVASFYAVYTYAAHITLYDPYSNSEGHVPSWLVALSPHSYRDATPTLKGGAFPITSYAYEAVMGSASALVELLALAVVRPTVGLISLARGFSLRILEHSRVSLCLGGSSSLLHAVTLVEETLGRQRTRDGLPSVVIKAKNLLKRIFTEEFWAIESNDWTRCSA